MFCQFNAYNIIAHTPTHARTHTHTQSCIRAVGLKQRSESRTLPDCGLVWGMPDSVIVVGLTCVDNQSEDTTMDWSRVDRRGIEM